MTSRRIAAPAPGAPDIIRFPDPRPCDLDVTTFEYVNFPAYPPSLASHFGNPDTTIITSEVAAGVRSTGSYEGVLFPDLLIAFNVDSAAPPRPQRLPHLRAGQAAGLRAGSGL